MTGPTWLFLLKFKFQTGHIPHSYKYKDNLKPSFFILTKSEHQTKKSKEQKAEMIIS